MSFFKPERPVFLTGPYAYLPERVITNEDLLNWMQAKARASWIEHRTGIQERRWANESQAVSDLAYQSATELFHAKPIHKDQIKNLVLCTVSGDYPTPPTAPLLQERLGLVESGAMDLGAACAGFTTGIHTASALALATRQNQLLIAAEIRSKFLSKEDFATATLFGDGSCAALVSTDPTHADFEILGSQLFSEGSVADLVSIQAGGSRLPESENTNSKKLKMKDGAAVFVKAVQGMMDAAKTFTQNLKFPLQEIHWLVPHQANLNLIKELSNRLEFPLDRVTQVVQHTGNTSGASVGIALAAGLQAKHYQPGQLLLLISAGGGGLAACALLRKLGPQ